MTKAKRAPRGGFTRTPNDVWSHPLLRDVKCRKGSKIPRSDLVALLIYLASHDSDWLFKVDVTRRVLEWCEEKYTARIKYLSDCGLVTVENVHEGRPRVGQRIRVNFDRLKEAPGGLEGDQLTPGNSVLVEDD